jgi:hypothetical protein
VVTTKIKNAQQSICILAGIDWKCLQLFENNVKMVGSASLAEVTSWVALGRV